MANNYIGRAMVDPAIGVFCVGAFVGAIVTYGLHTIDNFTHSQKAIMTILSATFGGSALAFVESISGAAALSAYGAGLLLALMWAYTKVALVNIASAQLGLRVLGWLHILSVVLCSLVGAFLFVLPALIQQWKVIRESL